MPHYALPHWLSIWIAERPSAFNVCNFTSPSIYPSIHPSSPGPSRQEISNDTLCNPLSLPIPHPRYPSMPVTIAGVNTRFFQDIPTRTRSPSSWKTEKPKTNSPHLLLQLKDPIHQRLARRRTPRHIDIHRHNPITPPRHTIAIMIIPPPIGAAAHGDHPAGIGHLVVDLPQGGRHLVGQGAGHDHDVGLAGGGAEDDAQTVLVVAGCGEVHHFDGAAGEAEGHGPEGALAGPVRYLVEGCSVTG